MSYRDEEARRQRAYLFLGLVALFVLIGVGRLFHLQVIDGDRHRVISDDNRFRKEVLRARRGRILDREGRVLVDNFVSFALTVNPYAPELRDRDDLARVVGRVARIIEADSAEAYAKVTSSRRESFLPVRLERNLTDAEVARIEEASAELPGVRIRFEPLRRYPEGSLAAHLLGYVGEIRAREYEERKDRGYEADDQVGRAAIEERYDEELHGRNGVRYVEVDAFGRARNFSWVLEPEDPARGQDLILTLDLDLQRALEHAMDSADSLSVSPRAHRVTGPVVGAAVAIDVWTGEILAMTSRPAFDPNRFAAGLDTRTWEELRDGPDKPLLNRVIQSRYPPGSTFKMLVASAALDSGLVTTRTQLEPCYGRWRFGNRTFRCWRPQGHARTDMWGAIEQSCDVYFYQIGDMLGVKGIAAFAHRFGIGRRTGIDLAGEVGGLIPDPAYMTNRYGRDGWSRGAALNMSIGQGEFLFTPIQLAVHTALIANGGDLVRPHLVMHPVNPDGERIPTPVPPRTPVARDMGTILSVMRAMMVEVVEGEKGTGGQAETEGLRVAGKTGTSQNPHGEDHALFVSFAPADTPEVALVVVLERRGHGGAEAAPVAGAFWRAFQALRTRDAATEVAAGEEVVG